MYRRQKRNFFGARIVRGLPPPLCHALLWSGVALFAWGEAYAIRQSFSLAAGRQQAVTIRPSPADPANDRAIVHLTAPITSSAPAVDAIFGQVGNAAALRRTVEVHQWRAASSSAGFDLVWSKDEIDTREDGAPPEFINPRRLLAPRLFLASGLRLGAFVLDDVVLGAVSSYEPIPSSKEFASQLALRLPGYEGYFDGGWMILSPSPPGPPRSARSKVPTWPPGAIRIRFSQVPLGPLTVVARQEGEMLRSFDAPNGAQVLIARAGAVSLDAAFQSAESSSTFVFWAIRILGAGIAFAALHNLMRARDRLRKYGPDYFDSDD